MKNKILILITFVILYSNVALSQQYVPGTILLKDANGNEVKWGQDENNSGSCSPSYNQACPSGSFCGHTLAGCGAVAMGQIMWKWKWPQSSSYRTYNWDLIPYRLIQGQTAQGNEIANLLRDCGRVVDMNYIDINIDVIINIEITGSWCTIGDLEDGLRTFNYKSAMAYAKWPYGNAWEDLIRSEIDAGRPVIYFGEESLISPKKHYFVIDGYKADDNTQFHINFGWNGGSNGYYKLNNTKGYTAHQKAIVGICPTLPNSSNENLTSVSYTTVSNTKTETARQNISLPATNKTLIVNNNGGNYTLTAGSSIVLKPGFQAKEGSKFVASIDPIYQINKEIKVPVWYTAITPFDGNGLNDVYCVDSENADSWELEVFNRLSQPIFQSAGNFVPGTRIGIWDGTNCNGPGSFLCYIRLKNKYGYSLEKSLMVEVVNVSNKSAKMKSDTLLIIDDNSYKVNYDTLVFKDKEFWIEDYIVGSNVIEINNDIAISPNPTTGLIDIQFSELSTKNIAVYNNAGILVYQKDDITSSTYQINLSSFADGLYVVRIEANNNGVVTKNIILKR